MGKRLVAALCLLSISAIAEDLRIVDVLRQGPPPYVDADRVYRVEGDGCAVLRAGAQLQVYRLQGGRKCGVLTVIQAGSTFVLARLTSREALYPLKGDALVEVGDPKALADLAKKFRPEDGGPGSLTTPEPTAPPLPVKAALGTTQTRQPSAPQSPDNDLVMVKPDSRAPKPVPRTALAASSRWTFGLVVLSPTLEGSYYRKSSSVLDSFDTARDLQLSRSGAAPGLFIEYQGTRHLVHFGASQASFSGNTTLQREVNFDTTTYQAGGQLQSEFKLRSYAIDWTIKVWRRDQLYVGVDLGLNYWDIQADLVGLGSVQAEPGSLILSRTHGSTLLPLPQAGLSLGLAGQGPFSGRGYFHFITAMGASYKRVGLDLRYEPSRRIGFRGFLEREALDVPLGSISNTMAIRMDKNGVGVGVYFRL